MNKCRSILKTNRTHAQFCDYNSDDEDDSIRNYISQVTNLKEPTAELLPLKYTGSEGAKRHHFPTLENKQVGMSDLY
jgi:hypothetical protein